ncbi:MULTISPECIES: RNA polymerase sigma factor [unclassified Carboxylicivirga]|uniref:RNA polymerase sigma factor n=1 Tax=Carboxylicivirga TaxID=1628153 RepID=UPI003D353D8D
MSIIISSESAEKIKEGNEAEFKKVYTRTAENLYNFILSYVKDAGEAEELLQQLFVKFWEKRSGIDPNKNVSSFLYKVAANLVYDHLRQISVARELIDVDEIGCDDVAHNDLMENIDHSELQQQIFEIVEQLPEQRKKIFILSRREGLSHDEISQELSISRRTVENQIYRALQTIKKELSSNEAWSDLLTFACLYYNFMAY